MSSEISASVGRWEKGARNLRDDVRTVQRLLKTAAAILEAPEIDPKGVDGKISRPSATSDTVEAIEAFQSRFTSAVDGVIAPGSQTWAALVGVAAKVPTAPENVLDVSQWLFPFPAVPTKSWEERPRSFASPRAGGARLHGPYPFYCETFALEIDHGPFLARYGEIQSKTEVIAGAKVKAGQKIASVGHLIGIQVPSDMLHFELYDKSLSGPLTVASDSGSAMKNGVPFMRRRDLIDPTLQLNQWRENLPAA